MRNSFNNMRQGDKQLIDFFNAKLTIFYQLYSEGETEESFDLFYESFFLGLENLDLARKNQEQNPKNIAAMRKVCVDQLASANERKCLGLTPGINPRNDFRNKFQKVKKTFHQKNEEIVCFYCNQDGYKWPDCLKFLAEKTKTKGHIMKRKNQSRSTDKQTNFGNKKNANPRSNKGRNFKQPE